MKLSHSPYTFVANKDGSLNFEISISGTIPASSVAQTRGDVQNRVTSRMRFDETAIQFDDFIASMPKTVGDDFINACTFALKNGGESL